MGSHDKPDSEDEKDGPKWEQDGQKPGGGR